MQKTADYISTLENLTPSHGHYRVRIYEDEGQLPIVVVTNPTPGEALTPGLSNAAPRLAALIARRDLPKASELRLATRYPHTTHEEPDPLAALYEISAFAILGNGQAAYREPARFGEPPPIEPQASLCSRADLEAFIGQPL